MIDEVIERMRKVGGIVSETGKDTQAKQEDTEDILLWDNVVKTTLQKDMLSFARFYGKSSDALLVTKAINMKAEYTGKETNFGVKLHNNRRQNYWQTLPVRCLGPVLGTYLTHLCAHNSGNPILFGSLSQELMCFQNKISWNTWSICTSGISTSSSHSCTDQPSFVN